MSKSYKKIDTKEKIKPVNKGQKKKAFGTKRSKNYIIDEDEDELSF